MDASDLDPVAELLIQGYLGTASTNRQFHDDWGQPLTIAARAHYLRSICQALVSQSERLRLDPDYAEFGRLAFRDLELNRDYVVRSQSAVSIEAEMQQESLFRIKQIESKVRLLVYSFHKIGVDLFVANTRRPLGRKRLMPSSPAAFVGRWPFGAGGGPSFDQGGFDAFEELGDLGYEDGELAGE